MKAEKNIIAEMERLYNQYCKEIEELKGQGIVTDKTAETYTYHPKNFIRWCKGDFDPGDKNKKTSKKK